MKLNVNKFQKILTKLGLVIVFGFSEDDPAEYKVPVWIWIERASHYRKRTE